MKFEALTPDTTVFDVRRTKMGNTTLTTVSVWPVYIEQVNPEKRTVLARWNGNASRSYSQASYSKWRKTEPMLIPQGLGSKRLATRAEIAAAKAAEKRQTPTEET